MQVQPPLKLHIRRPLNVSDRSYTHAEQYKRAHERKLSLEHTYQQFWHYSNGAVGATFVIKK